MSIARNFVPALILFIAASAHLGCVEQLEPLGMRGCSLDSDCPADKSCVVGMCVVNDPPRAEAGADLLVQVGQRVTLDGRGTTDVNGDRLKFEWVQAGGEARVQLSPADAEIRGGSAPGAVAQFTAPITSGDLAFELRVRDGAQGDDAAKDQVVVTVTNDAPTADGGAAAISPAGADVDDPADADEGPVGGGGQDDPEAGPAELFTTAEVDSGDQVVLDGTASTDPEGLPLTYRWRQTAGAPVQLQAADTAVAKFVASVDKGGLAFELSVDDGEHGSAPAPVQVIVLNQDPVAVLDAQRTVAPTSVVTMDGSDSFDPDGDPISFRWAQVSGEPVHLQIADEADGGPSVSRFAAPRTRGELVFRLEVDDDDGGKGVAEIRILVANSPPVAQISPAVVEAEPGTLVRLEAGESHDVDGDPLTYDWHQVEGPAVVLLGGDGPRPQLQTPLQRTALAFALVVSDGAARSAPARALINVGNQRPVAAIAGAADRTVAPDSRVTLDGSPSADADGDSLTYHWRQRSGPAAAVTGADSATPTLRAPADRAEVTFELVVSDGIVDSEPALVRLHVANQAPTADAGPDLQAAPERTVQLDGTRSIDPDGDAITYSWRQISGEPVLLSDARSGLPKFETPARRQALQFELIVSDGLVASAPDTVVVHIGNTPPIADAGRDQIGIARAAPANLDGSASSDADGDPLTFRWRQVAGPEVQIANAASARTAFVAPNRRQELEFELIVDDGLAASPPARVRVTTANTPPVARAGDDQHVEGADEVTLDASDSSDPDGDAVSFRWEQIEGTPVEIVGGDTPGARFTAPVARAELTLRVTVSDGADERTDTVTVFVRNHPPVADAGPGQIAEADSEVTLDGSGSIDLDGDALAFDWVQTGGEAVELVGADTDAPTFRTVDGPGSYVFELTVRDGAAASEPDAVEITVDNRRPVANAGPDREGILGGVQVTLDGGGSADPDGDGLTFSWAQVGGPVVILDDPTSPGPTFTTPRPRAELRFQLVVDDGLQASEPDVVAIRTANNAPVADAGQAREAPSGGPVTLDATASADIDEDPLSCAWRQTAGPQVIVIGPDRCVAQFTAPIRRSALHFEVEVADGHGGQDLARTVVTVANNRPTADAGDDLHVDPRAVVALDGRRSLDLDDDELSYAWLQVDGPRVNLALADTPQPQFAAPDRRAELTFELAVNDGTVDSAADRIVVHVRNTRPVADAGPDRLVAGGSHVQLDGTQSSDADADELAFAWTQLQGTPVNLDDADNAHSTFVAPRARDHLIFQLVVSDGLADSLPSLVDIRTPNNPPSPDAGPPQSVDGRSQVALDATGSSDIDGDELTYWWDQAGGTAVVLSDRESATPTFTAPAVRGDLVFRVKVNDGDAWSELDNVSINIRNTPPTAHAGNDQAVDGGDEVRLDGRGSSDPDGDPITYEWLVPDPSIELDDPTAAQPRFTTPVPRQDLVFQLRVTDSEGGVSGLDEVTISTRNNAPTVDLGADRWAAPETEVDLNADGASDVDGDELSYAWVQTKGEEVRLRTEDGGRVLKFDTPAADTDLEFRLTATDPFGAHGVDTIKVKVREWIADLDNN